MISPIQAAFGATVHYAANHNDRTRAQQFRAEQRQGSGRGDEVADLDALTTNQPEDAVVVLYAESNGKIVGCANMHFYLFTNIPQSLRNLHNITPLARIIGKEQIAVISGLVVDPTRGQIEIRLKLLTALYKLALAAGATVCYAVSGLDDLKLFLGLGFRQHMEGIHPDGTHLLLPLVLSLRDSDRLSAHGSPLARVPDEDTDPRHGRTITNLINAIYNLPDGADTGPARTSRYGWRGLSTACQF
jgi:N-acetylglutamate synthase-like GNAT family acetyltransferase